ncbi:MAG: hypothetical protein U5P41_13190 [Gammaproteobacteria bacterium]|nr:hypothetical protein [Gammaproteobacteria bacterium]
MQEGLTNISKHSDANEIHISLSRKYLNNGDGVELVLTDDGLGFNADKTRWGLGLLGMRERCEALGGNFSLARGAGQRGIYMHYHSTVRQRR